MRRFFISILLVVLMLSLAVSVSAETQATSVSTFATVSSDESCDVTMTVSFHLDEPVSKLTFPIPNKANNVTLNGSRTGTSGSGGVRLVDLTKITGGLPGDFTVVITYHLNDVVAFNEEGFLVLDVPLLSGFDYPVAKLEASVLLPGEVVTKPAFSSGYHNTNIEQYLTSSVTGATITCATNRELKDHETLAMSLNVTDAMFPQSVIRVQNLTPLYILMGVCAGIALAYWFIFLRFLPPAFPSVANPPDGFSAGHMGSLLSLKSVDLNTMVLSWGQQGYLLITLDKRDRVLLHKRIDMGNERSSFEQKCFKALFGNRTVVDATSLRYALTIQKVARSSPNTHNFVHPKSGSFLPFRVFMALVGMFDGICLGLTMAHESAAPWFIGIVFGLIFLFGSWHIQNWMNGLLSYRKDHLYVGLGLILVWLVLTLFTGTAAVDIWVILGQFLAGFLLTFGGRRTPEGRRACGEVLGLMRYLFTISRLQVDYVCQHNPDYFFDLAPYAIALGVDKRFASKFGKMPLDTCPYLIAPVSGRLTAAQWSDILSQTLRLMDGKHRRLALDNILSILRGFSK